MPRFRALARISARLLAAGPPHAVRPGRRHRFRLLVIGPAVLVRAEPGPWRVRVAGGIAPRPVAAGVGVGAVGLRSAVRVAAALLDPLDLATGGHDLVTAFHGQRPPTAGTEFYGWSLLYQLPHMRGRAVIDSHDSFSELPAFYESPLELVDRSAFLTARGIPHRPLALLTQPEDFVPAQTGRGSRNRFASDASLHRTCPLHNLWPG